MRMTMRALKVFRRSSSRALSAAPRARVATPALLAPVVLESALGLHLLAKLRFGEAHVGHDGGAAGPLLLAVERGVAALHARVATRGLGECGIPIGGLFMDGGRLARRF